MVSGCTEFYLVKPDDGCWAIANDNEISPDDFYAWNPAVGAGCETLQPDFYVCVGKGGSSITQTPTSIATTSPPPTTTLPAAPGPTQPGIPENCNSWMAQKPDTYCQDMADAARITLDRLYALNPALGGDCSGLWVGYFYCTGTT